MSQSEARFQRNLKLRTAVLCAVLAALPLLVLRKAFDLQVVRASELKAQAEGQSRRKLALTPQRGGIFDRDGAELAVSVDADTIWANPRQLRKSVKDFPEAVKSLATLLEIEPATLSRKLASDKFFVWVKRRASAAESKAVQALKLPGVSVSKQARRYYPNRELAAHVLGHADVDGRGLSGVELMLDEKLRGSRTSAPVVRDGRGNVVYSEHLLDDLTTQGHDVTLTIDKTLQYFAERELELAVRTAEARAGSVVVVDPTRGEILALANYPTFNLNEAQHASDAQRRNRAIVERFEPGSTTKPFVMAGALAAGTVKLTDSIDCSADSLVVDGRAIHDAHRFGMLTPSEVISRSSNIGISKVGTTLGRERLFSVLQNFGFGAVPGSGLPGEVAGSLRPYQRWYAMDAATIPFGQGMSTTTLQLAMSMSAFANKGRLLEPLLVKRVVDARGQTVEEPLPRVRKQVVSERIARSVTDMLVGVTTEGGTGTEAAIEGYLVAGKTGTAQKSDPEHGGYAKDKWVSSFVGFAPANKPRLTIAVVLDEPMIAHQGGAVAAPMFRRVMEASLRHLGVAPERAPNNAVALTRSAPPRAESKPVWPLSNVEMPLPRNVGPGETLVPNLVGRPARLALVHARQAMLEVALQGSGVVSEQQPAPGSVVKRGALVSLQLNSPTPELPAPPLASDLAQALPQPIASDGPPPTAAGTRDKLRVPPRRGQDG
ncbi:MAG TPA: penicillin-binding protein [Polyangiales bacterium]|nr:penicillin-binding protein [Polyangiales bacterium]